MNKTLILLQTLVMKVEKGDMVIYTNSQSLAKRIRSIRPDVSVRVIANIRESPPKQHCSYRRYGG
jgi:hypothetical protein